MSSVTLERWLGLHHRKFNVQLEPSRHFSTMEAVCCVYMAHMLVFAVIFLVASQYHENETVQLLTLEFANPTGFGLGIVASPTRYIADPDFLPSHEPERHMGVKRLTFTDLKNYDSTAANESATGLFNWDPYIGELSSRIKEDWIPVGIKTQNEVVVQFKVHSDGTLSDLHVLRSNDSPQITNAVLKAVERAAPFGAFPHGAVGTLDVELTL